MLRRSPICLVGVTSGAGEGPTKPGRELVAPCSPGGGWKWGGRITLQMEHPQTGQGLCSRCGVAGVPRAGRRGHRDVGS